MLQTVLIKPEDVWTGMSLLWLISTARNMTRQSQEGYTAETVVQGQGIPAPWGLHPQPHTELSVQEVVAKWVFDSCYDDGLLQARMQACICHLLLARGQLQTNAPKSTNITGLISQTLFCCLAPRVSMLHMTIVTLSTSLLGRQRWHCIGSALALHLAHAGTCDTITIFIVCIITAITGSGQR